MFEGVPNYPTRVALLAGVREAQGQPVLHRTHRHPRADAGRATTTSHRPISSQVAASARHGRRADQPGSLGLVLTASSAAGAARSSTPGGRPRPAAPDHPVAGRHPHQAGLGHQPFFGVQPELVDDNEGRGDRRGNRGRAMLCASRASPGRARCAPSTSDHDRFVQTYFSRLQRLKYFTGDGCRRDADGYYWITGRVDDVINDSGHRMGTAEVESALVAHDKVSEAAVRRLPARGQGCRASTPTSR